MPHVVECVVRRVPLQVSCLDQKGRKGFLALCSASHCHGSAVCTDTDCGYAEGVAVYKDIPFMTSNGPVTSSLQNARVS